MPTITTNHAITNTYHYNNYYYYYYTTSKEISAISLAYSSGISA